MVEHPQLAVLRERRKLLVAQNDQLRREIEEELPPFIRIAKWVDIGVRASRMVRSFCTGRNALYVFAGLGVLTAVLVRSGVFTKQGLASFASRLLKTSNYVSIGWQAIQRVKGSWQFLRSFVLPPKSQVAE